MAIQPVSDLVLDVINQADPTEVRAATRALKAPAVVSKDLPVSEPSWASSSFSRFMAEAESAKAKGRRVLSNSTRWPIATPRSWTMLILAKSLKAQSSKPS